MKFKKLSRKILRIGTAVCTIINPPLGLALGAVTAGVQIADNERDCRKRNTQIDQECNEDQAKLLHKNSAELAANQIKLSNDYAALIDLLSQAQNLQTKEYLQLKNHLERRGRSIERFSDIIRVLQACFEGNEQKIIAGFAQFEDDIYALVEWGLLHILLLCKEEQLTKEFYYQCCFELDAEEQDFLGHSLLEYAYLSESSFMVQELQYKIRSAQSEANYKAADELIARRLPDTKKSIDFNAGLCHAISTRDLALVKALSLKVNYNYATGSIIQAYGVAAKLPVAEGFAFVYAMLTNIHGLFDYPLDPHHHFKLDEKYQQLIQVIAWLLYEGNGHFPCDFVSYRINGLTPLGHAIQTQNYNMVSMLLELGVQVNQADTNGDTALIIATRAADDYLLNLLLVSGADPWLENFKREAALSLATDEQRALIEDFIFSQGEVNYRATDDDEQALAMVKQSQHHEKLAASINFIEQAGLHKTQYNLNGKLNPIEQMEVIQGQYALGLQQTIATGIEELPYLCRVLALAVDLVTVDNDDKHSQTFGDKSAPQIKIIRHNNSYQVLVNNQIVKLKNIAQQRPQALPRVFDLALPDNTELSSTEYVENLHQALKQKSTLWPAARLSAALGRESGPGLNSTHNCNLVKQITNNLY